MLVFETEVDQFHKLCFQEITFFFNCCARIAFEGIGLLVYVGRFGINLGAHVIEEVDSQVWVRAEIEVMQSFIVCAYHVRPTLLSDMIPMMSPGRCLS